LPRRCESNFPPGIKPGALASLFHVSVADTWLRNAKVPVL